MFLQLCNADITGSFIAFFISGLNHLLRYGLYPVINKKTVSIWEADLLFDVMGNIEV